MMQPGLTRLGYPLEHIALLEPYREDRLSRSLSPDPVTNKLSLSKRVWIPS